MARIKYGEYLASRGGGLIGLLKDFDERTTAYAKKLQDEETLKKAPPSSKKSAKGGSSSSGGGGGGKKDDDRDRWKGKTQPKGEPKEWEVKEYDKSMLHGKHGRFNRDPKAVSESGKRLWWVKDTAEHGESQWKVYEEHGDSLEWYKDVDKHGNYISGKFKGDVGKSLSIKDFISISKK